MSNNLIFKQMNLVMKDVGAIGKNHTNTQQNFKFRGVDDFVNALYPALTKHGVFMTPECVSYTQELRDVTRTSGKAGIDKHVALQVKYHFYAEDGSTVSVGPIPAEGLDSGDKATNKALSAALKYALIQTFSIPTVDMAEADSESPTIDKVKTTTEAVIKATVAATATPTVVTTAAAPTSSSPQTTSGTAAAKGRTTFRSTKAPAATTTTATTSNGAVATAVANASNGSDNGWN